MGDLVLDQPYSRSLTIISKILLVFVGLAVLSQGLVVVALFKVVGIMLNVIEQEMIGSTLERLMKDASVNENWRIMFGIAAWFFFAIWTFLIIRQLDALLGEENRANFATIPVLIFPIVGQVASLFYLLRVSKKAESFYERWNQPFPCYMKYIIPLWWGLDISYFLYNRFGIDILRDSSWTTENPLHSFSLIFLANILCLVASMLFFFLINKLGQPPRIETPSTQFPPPLPSQ